MQQNLGLVERGIRLLLSLSLVTVLVQRDTFGWLEAALSVVALFLLLNAMSARCYLWRWLGISSTREGGASCATSKVQEDASID